MLVVDDEPEIVRYLEYVLRRLGHETVSAGNGAEAIEQAFAAPPDLVLLDVMMPVMDGVQFLKELRASEELKRIPVLVTSATSQRPQAVEGFLPKPISLASLLEAVHRFARPDRSASVAPA